MILLSHLSHARLATTSMSVIKVILVNQQTLKSKDSICTIKEAQSGLIYVDKPDVSEIIDIFTCKNIVFLRVFRYHISRW